MHHLGVYLRLYLHWKRICINNSIQVREYLESNKSMTFEHLLELVKVRQTKELLVVNSHWSVIPSWDFDFVALHNAYLFEWKVQSLLSMVDVSNLHDSWNQCSVAMVWCFVCYGWFEPYWNQSVYLYVKDCSSFSILLYMDEQKKWCCEWHNKLREKKDDIRLVS